MPTGLREELGLSEPQSQESSPQGSTAQADQFRAAFQAEVGRVNESLQYTAAHAEQEMHDPQAGKRDTTCSAYQVALGRIDPTNPAVAQGAIDQVLAAVQGLSSTVDTLKQAVERAYIAWIGRESDLDDVSDKIREMVEWGHDKAAALQQIIEAIASKANLRKWEEALQALEQLLSKIATIYEEFLRQKAAQEEYEAELATLEPQLAETSTCEFASLEARQQEITTAADQMRQTAETKDYVSALEQLRSLQQLVTDYLSELEQMRARKDEYEQARAELEPRLGEASTSEFASLAELDQQIADLTTRMDEAAAAEEYEQARAELEPRLGEASTSEFASLAELDQQIADLTTRMDEAAAAEEYEQARDTVNELSTTVDEKLTRVAEIEAAREEYEQARAELEPRLGEASTSEYASLAELDQQIADLTTRMDEAAAAEEYEQAREIVNELSTKVDEKLTRVAEIEAAREEYEQARAALEPRLTEASTSRYESLAELDQQIADLTTRMDEAAAAEEYEQALQLLNQLSALVDRKLSEAGRIDRRIVGSAQQARAETRLESLDEDSRERFNRLAEATRTPAELDYLTQALAANHSLDEIETFAERIRGQDEEWMQNNLRLTGNTDGEGVMQQWETSCNATAAQAVRGQLDPVYALRLHDENVDVTVADDSDATATNPALAEEQRAMLESTYSGSSHAPHTGVADNRDGAAGTSAGRFADDLMNDMSDATGVQYSYQGVDGSYSADDVVTDVEAGVRQGHPVPLVVGGSSSDSAHYVLVTGSDPGPPPTWTVHDPWDGITVERTVEDMRTGNVNLAGHTHISGIENPAAVE